jgi:hypothetical protein
VVNRFGVVNKLLNNTFLSTVVINSLCEHLAEELNVFAEALQESGDDFSQVAGIRRAAKIIYTKEVTSE